MPFAFPSESVFAFVGILTKDWINKLAPPALVCGNAYLVNPGAHYFALKCDGTVVVFDDPHLEEFFRKNASAEPVKIPCPWRIPERSQNQRFADLGRVAGMREFLVLLVHLVVVVVRLAKAGGVRSVVAESVLVRQQLLILNRGRRRAPNLRAADRFIAGVCTLFIGRARLLRSAIVLKPSTLLHLHRVLIRRKYRLLFSPTRRRRPGPKCPAQELIYAVVEMK